MQLVSTPPGAIAGTDRLVLQALRGLFIARRLREVPPAVVAACRTLDDETLHALEDMLRALENGHIRPPELRCLCQEHPSPDEELLLDVLALQAEGRPDDAYAVLRFFTNERAAALAGDAALRVVLQLEAAGILMDRGADAVRRHAFAALLPLTIPGARQEQGAGACLPH
ncbi:hypothetical protein [Rhizosaccharibacter radicis]|uniref:Uncharacterized protein n=1 Tax=Rhizosaccharibacter radicis TaxID=2782605 RepID=A0ABT1VWE0_9PROT|nr:hypothetical protein [Acetobacteraceae bacterium KSS12]